MAGRYGFGEPDVMKGKLDGTYRCYIEGTSVQVPVHVG